MCAIAIKALKEKTNHKNSNVTVTVRQRRQFSILKIQGKWCGLSLFKWKKNHYYHSLWNDNNYNIYGDHCRRVKYLSFLVKFMLFILNIRVGCTVKRIYCAYTLTAYTAFNILLIFRFKFVYFKQ